MGQIALLGQHLLVELHRGKMLALGEHVLAELLRGGLVPTTRGRYLLWDAYVIHVLRVSVQI